MRSPAPRIRLTGAASALLLTLSALAACGSDSSDGAAVADDPKDIASKAEGEGEVVWYSGSSEEPANAVAKAFEKKYGISVSITRLTSTDIGQRFQSEADAGKVQADVLSTVDPTLFGYLHDEGLTTTLSTSNVPSLANLDDEYVLDAGAAAVFGIGPTTVAWNTDVLPDFQGDDWQDLIDPSLEDEIVLVDPRASSAWADLWSLVLHDPELGEDYIKEFAGQGIRQVVDSSVPGAQMLAAGEGGLLMASTTSTQQPLVAEGAPLKEFTLESPAPAYQQYLALTSDAPHPNAGALFIDFLLSEEGQKLYNSKHVQASPLGDLPGVLPLPEGLETVSPEQREEDLPKIVDLLGLT